MKRTYCCSHHFFFSPDTLTLVFRNAHHQRLPWADQSNQSSITWLCQRWLWRSPTVGFRRGFTAQLDRQLPGVHSFLGRILAVPRSWTYLLFHCYNWILLAIWDVADWELCIFCHCGFHHGKSAFCMALTRFGERKIYPHLGRGPSDWLWRPIS